MNEGETVTIYVSTGVVNYVFSPTVSIRTDFYTKESTGYVSLWKNGSMVKESGKLDFKEVLSYTFEKLSGTQKEIEYTVKVRFGDDKEYYAYAIIKVDAAKDKTTEVSRRNDYKSYVSANQGEDAEPPKQEGEE